MIVQPGRKFLLVKKESEYIGARENARDGVDYTFAASLSTRQVSEAALRQL
jgi:hypothetical protein